MWTTRAAQSSAAASPARGLLVTVTRSFLAGAAGEVVGAGGQLHVAVPVHPGHLHLQRVAMPPAHRRREAYEALRVEGGPEFSHGAAPGEKGSGGGKDVSAGEGRAGRGQLIGQVLELDGQRRPAQGVERGQHQAIVGTDKDDVGRPRANGDGTPSGAHARVDDGQHDPGGQVRPRPFQGQAPRPHILGRYFVGQVNDGHQREAGPQHAVKGADEAVGQPVVGQQADDPGRVATLKGP